jgi:hypothetical protein
MKERAMSSWRDQILKEFTPKVSRLTLVADPDGLLLEEGILEGIRERGFELIPFEDHVEFRYAYESNFRSRWDRGEHTDLVVVLQSQACNIGSLPYDLLQAGRKLSFNLGDIFPNLSYPVLTALDRGDLDPLYEAQQRHVPGPLGDNATKEFVLRHVFEIAPELIKQPSDLLRVLLRRHYRGQRIPKILDERFIQILRQNNSFSEWPLEAIVADREVFFAFLQERWPAFLDQIAVSGEPMVREKAERHAIKYPGPVDLPFDHQDIKVYIDTLFLEGILQSVPHEYGASLAQTWAGIGVKLDPAKDRSRRLAKLLESIPTTIPTQDARYGDWSLFARGWAELIATFHEEASDIKIGSSIKDLQTQTDHSFLSWLARRYTALINLPPVPPVMVHHLPRFLARCVAEDKGYKVALLVIDGLALDQWIVVREAIALQRPDVSFREHMIFAWIPSLTSISRQAIFAGRPPILFPNSIQVTEKEPALWAQFWADQGLMPNEVAYAKGLGDGDLDQIEALLSLPRLKVAGLVVDKVDKIMHGMELGAAGMHNQVRQWAQENYLPSLLDLILDSGFHLFLTSDHGNIETEGCGRPAEGVVADVRGERVRIYSDASLRDKVRERFPTALEWPPIGLPSDYLPLIAPHRKAFVREDERLVSHGGLSVEEIIVPLVQIERRDA